LQKLKKQQISSINILAKKFMAVKTVDIEDFLQLAQELPVFDVRSPAEFSHAHFPAALSFPLFSDEERKVVGTTYKQISREDAIKIGLDYFGPKMRTMVETAEALVQKSGSNKIIVHCWRGGMRSAAIAWLLDLYGFEVYLLSGGYKAFRKWVLAYFDNVLPMMVIGGYTGSGKTEVLNSLASKGEFIIDLEKIAGHRGSAFGNLGLPTQPGMEQVENELAVYLRKIKAELAISDKKWVWIEDESRRIGNINLPEGFYKHLKKAPFIFLDVPFELRLDTILKNYGKFSTEDLENGIYRIRKRMGNDLNTKAIQLLHENNIKGSFEILLNYYDRFYLKSSFSHVRILKNAELTGYSPNEISDYLIETKKMYADS
jgi:tRNA 2-selenouridine synthase